MSFFFFVAQNYYPQSGTYLSFPPATNWVVNGGNGILVDNFFTTALGAFNVVPPPIYNAAALQASGQIIDSGVYGTPWLTGNSYTTMSAWPEQMMFYLNEVADKHGWPEWEWFRILSDGSQETFVPQSGRPYGLTGYPTNFIDFWAQFDDAFDFILKRLYYVQENTPQPSSSILQTMMNNFIVPNSGGSILPHNVFNLPYGSGYLAMRKVPAGYYSNLFSPFAANPSIGFIVVGQQYRQGTVSVRHSDALPAPTMSELIAVPEVVTIINDQNGIPISEIITPGNYAIASYTSSTPLGTSTSNMPVTIFPQIDPTPYVPQAIQNMLGQSWTSFFGIGEPPSVNLVSVNTTISDGGSQEIASANCYQANVDVDAFFGDNFVLYLNECTYKFPPFAAVVNQLIDVKTTQVADIMILHVGDYGLTSKFGITSAAESASGMYVYTSGIVMEPAYGLYLPFGTVGPVAGNYTSDGSYEQLQSQNPTLPSWPSGSFLSSMVSVPVTTQNEAFNTTIPSTAEYGWITLTDNEIFTLTQSGFLDKVGSTQGQPLNFGALDSIISAQGQGNFLWVRLIRDYTQPVYHPPTNEFNNPQSQLFAPNPSIQGKNVSNLPDGGYYPALPGQGQFINGIFVPFSGQIDAVSPRPYAYGLPWTATSGPSGINTMPTPSSNFFAKLYWSITNQAAVEGPGSFQVGFREPNTGWYD